MWPSLPSCIVGVDALGCLQSEGVIRPFDGVLMRIGRLAAFCYGMGLFIGGAASAGLLLGFSPSRLPPVLLDIAAYKLAFLATFLLFAVAAVLTRHERRQERDRATRSVETLAPSVPGALNAASAASDLEQATRLKERERI